MSKKVFGFLWVGALVGVVAFSTLDWHLPMLVLALLLWWWVGDVYYKHY